LKLKQSLCSATRIWYSYTVVLQYYYYYYFKHNPLQLYYGILPVPVEWYGRSCLHPNLNLKGAQGNFAKPVSSIPVESKRLWSVGAS
jgi:hypothetical protein